MKDLGRIKMVVSDLDGTIINGLEFTDFAENIINRLIEQNYLFCIATGRNMRMCMDSFHIKGLYYILMNGTSIYFDDQKIMSNNGIGNNDIRFLIDYGINAEASILLLSDNKFISVGGNGYIADEKDERFKCDYVINSFNELKDDIAKVEMYFKNYDLCKIAYDELFKNQ